ncbi:TetR/AcrR family transcriptional regulator [Virgisporangium aliadipatigenens]|uniref:TetR/AcrR family transcriptional regulator n=1 Tax=Virgisporangium aliadipatigenens TaxID=741659 RepID=UPI001940F044|nr:TetR/AcrR family transcriptional regulator [Virgisporangium aliadipatigenens]
MTDATRAYNSPRRAQHAQQTREDVLRTARELFVSQGYARVTMADIARAGGVSVRTVYLSVGTKADVLHALLLGDVAASPNASAALEQIRGTPDLRTALVAVAAGTRADQEMFKTSIDLLHSARSSDAGAHEVWRQVVANCRDALGEIARHLVAAGLVRQDVDRVADHLWFYFGLYSWRSLIEECGWSYDAAERWLVQQACITLTDPSGRTS